MATQTDIDFDTADFDAAYTGGSLLPDGTVSGVPWDIGRVQPLVEAAAAAGRIRGHVLDAGCGLGDNAAFLTRSGCRVTALDASPAAVEMARVRTRGLDIDFVVADATNLSGFDGAFDAVLDSALFHTLPAKLRRPWLTSARRVVREDGTLTLITFADVEGGMPAPLSVCEDELRDALATTHWSLDDLRSGDFLGSAEAIAGFATKVGMTPRIGPDGRTRLPCWVVTASPT